MELVNTSTPLLVWALVLSSLLVVVVGIFSYWIIKKFIK